MSFNYDADLETASKDTWAVICGVTQLPPKRQRRKYPRDVCNYLQIERI